MNDMLYGAILAWTACIIAFIAYEVIVWAMWMKGWQR